MLGNLLANAIDALDGADVRRDLAIRLTSARRHDAEIVVRNTGPCIDAGFLPRLFEPFVTSKPPGKGLGLGLVISSQSCVPSVAAACEQPRPTGGEFHRRTSLAAVDRLHALSDSTPPIAVVFVEDDEDVRLRQRAGAGAGRLRGDGLRQSEAARAHLTAGLPAVVVCDVKLPGISGTAWARDLTGSMRSCPSS